MSAFIDNNWHFAIGWRVGACIHDQDWISCEFQKSDRVTGASNFRYTYDKYTKNIYSFVTMVNSWCPKFGTMVQPVCKHEFIEGVVVRANTKYGVNVDAGWLILCPGVKYEWMSEKNFFKLKINLYLSYIIGIFQYDLLYSSTWDVLHT